VHACQTARVSGPSRDVDPTLAHESIAGSFPGELGIEFSSIEADEVVGGLSVDERHLHPGGYVHGGVWVSLADTVAAWGTMRNLPEGRGFTTVELKCNVFASASPGDRLVATGRPRHVGGRTQAWEVRVEKGGRLAAFFTCTQMVLDAGS